MSDQSSRLIPDPLYAPDINEAMESLRRPRPAYEVFIYFIQCASSGRIKIGSSADPWRRLTLLQTGCPTDLSIIHAFRAPRYVELDLQRKHRIRGEWFDPAPEILAFIDGLRTGAAMP